jgi:hypothetical protein
MKKLLLILFVLLNAGTTNAQVSFTTDKMLVNKMPTDLKMKFEVTDTTFTQEIVDKVALKMLQKQGQSPITVMRYNFTKTVFGENISYNYRDDVTDIAITKSSNKWVVSFRLKDSFTNTLVSDILYY